MNTKYHLNGIHRDYIEYGPFGVDMKVFTHQTVFALWLRTADATGSPLLMESMTCSDNPELFSLYDFENNQWIESEVSQFLDGLQVCLA